MIINIYIHSKVRENKVREKSGNFDILCGNPAIVSSYFMNII